MSIRCLALTLALAALTACGPRPQEPAPTSPAPPPPPATSPSESPGAFGGGDETPEPAATGVASLEDGVQVARLQVTEAGFVPKTVEVAQGTPARLLITRKTDRTCATEVMSKALGIEKKPLPMDEEVTVEFTPAEAGSFTYGCGMDEMIQGTVVVLPSKEGAEGPAPSETP